MKRSEMLRRDVEIIEEAFAAYLKSGEFDSELLAEGIMNNHEVAGMLPPGYPNFDYPSKYSVKIDIIREWEQEDE